MIDYCVFHSVRLQAVQEKYTTVTLPFFEFFLPLKGTKSTLCPSARCRFFLCGFPRCARQDDYWNIKKKSQFYVYFFFSLLNQHAFQKVNFWKVWKKQIHLEWNLPYNRKSHIDRLSVISVQKCSTELILASGIVSLSFSNVTLLMFLFSFLYFFPVWEVICFVSWESK